MPSKEDPYQKKRAYWRAVPRRRPVTIEIPGPGQKSVWDFPRPPRVEPAPARVRVIFGGQVIADSTATLRVCETASPPVYYIPQEDIAPDVLSEGSGTTFCEWKGLARYWTVTVGDQSAENAAWSYAEPDEGFESIRDHVAFYPQRMDSCWVGEERVVPQAGHFYGGWITSDLTGPFKGEPGTEGW